MAFENLEVCKKSACLSGEIYKELKHLKDFGFKDVTIQRNFLLTLILDILTGNFRWSVIPEFDYH
jgi:hypothetical protein